MTRILIVEDDPIIQADIVRLLQAEGYECAAAGNAAKAISAIQAVAYDLFLLDISLGEGMDGIRLAGEIRKSQPQVPLIFVTSYYDPLTLAEARAVFPHAYLVKPFDSRTLTVNVELALYKNRKLETRVPADRLQKVFVRHRQELLAIHAADILYLEADDNYAFVHTASDKYYLTHTMKSMEEKLSGMGFQRIHKSFIVNLEKITSIQEGYVFIGETKLPLGRKFRQEFMAALTVL